MSKTKLIIAVTILCGGLTATAASAMPIAPLPAGTSATIEQVRWVCGPYGRCWWRPNYYGGYYGYGYYPRHRYYGYGYYPRHHYWRYRY